MMDKIYNEYKENIKYFFKNKFYMFSIIIITILCYGFYITNLSVGVDDFSQDRYVTGTYLLSQGRWGNVLFARLFNVVEFVPFWTEALAVVLFIFIAIILCAFIRKEASEYVNKTIYYIIFSGVLISYPVIHNIFLYNFANVITIVSSTAMIIVAILIYERTINLKLETNKNMIFYSMLILILPFFISMYEACCQTFLSFIFITLFIRLCKDSKITIQTFKYVVTCITVLSLAIFVNYFMNLIIKYILTLNGTLVANTSLRQVPWLNNSNAYEIFNIYFIKYLWSDINNFGYISEFFIISIITIILSIFQAIKKKDSMYFTLILAIFVSNFVINIMQARILYRANTSWSLTIAFMLLYILICFANYKYIKELVLILASFIIIYNSKALTSLFYNDNIRYEREKNIAYDIANTIIRTCDDPYKPLVYVIETAGNLQGNSINLDNGWSVLNWGASDSGITTKFINGLGYNFTYPTPNEWIEAQHEYEKIKEEHEKDFIIELDEYIIVKLIYEPR